MKVLFSDSKSAKLFTEIMLIFSHDNISFQFIKVLCIIIRKWKLDSIQLLMPNYKVFHCFLFAIISTLPWKKHKIMIFSCWWIDFRWSQIAEVTKPCFLFCIGHTWPRSEKNKYAKKATSDVLSAIFHSKGVINHTCIDYINVRFQVLALHV